MYWRATSIRFSRGRSTPAMRAISVLRTRGELALALLVAGVRRADDPHRPLALDDLALVANLLDRRADLHCASDAAPETKNPASTAGGLAAGTRTPCLAARSPRDF